VIDGCTGSHGGELCVPVRVGSRLVAASVARWPIDRIPPVQARELLELTAAVAAPRIDSMRARAREVANGSGKELVARALHQLSPRRERRCCDVNCAALPDDLLEPELFGHTKGAFTGAVADHAGLIEEADGGMLFLDEVADLSPRAQAKLAPVLQQQEVRRMAPPSVA
jgi:transcriptional regulator of acetoin/glycerol metabolism